MRIVLFTISSQCTSESLKSSDLSVYHSNWREGCVPLSGDAPARLSSSRRLAVPVTSVGLTSQAPRSVIGSTSDHAGSLNRWLARRSRQAGWPRRVRCLRAQYHPIKTFMSLRALNSHFCVITCPLNRSPPLPVLYNTFSSDFLQSCMISLLFPRDARALGNIIGFSACFRKHYRIQGAVGAKASTGLYRLKSCFNLSTTAQPSEFRRVFYIIRLFRF